MDIRNKVINIETKKIFAFDLDGTLTEHRTWITDENLAALEKARARGMKIIIVGAGQVKRIFAQLREYPVDIIGNYGLQYAVYSESKGGIEVVRDITMPCDIPSVRERVDQLREEFGFTEYTGETVEIHPSGCVTFPVLGTKADISEKLVFDPDRSKRRAVYDIVKNRFPEYTVFVGGSSSFDMAPNPYNKYHALKLYCEEEGYTPDEILYFGDDYGMGGNDESVYQSEIDFVTIDKYTQMPEIMDKILG